MTMEQERLKLKATLGGEWEPEKCPECDGFGSVTNWETGYAERCLVCSGRAYVFVTTSEKKDD